MDDAWWGPTVPLTGGPYFCLAERSLPGCILVNAAGQRFVNEAAPYVDAVHAMYDRHTDDKPHIPAWLVSDQRYRNNYVFAGLPPRKSLPRRWYAAGVVFRADTLAELAAQIGILADALTEMVVTHAKLLLFLLWLGRGRATPGDADAGRPAPAAAAGSPALAGAGAGRADEPVPIRAAAPQITRLTAAAKSRPAPARFPPAPPLTPAPAAAQPARAQAHRRPDAGATGPSTGRRWG